MSVTQLNKRPIASAPVEQLARRWWVPLLRGLAAIAFGILAIFWPGQTLLTLVLIYGAFALLDGALAILGALLDKSGVSSSWPLVLAGILGIGAGILTLTWPGLVMTGLLVYVGAWAIVRGILDVFEAMKLRQAMPNMWVQVISGLLSVAFGVLVFLAPKLGYALIVWPVAACAMLAGILLVAFAIGLRKLDGKLA
jgi:uncharacterized membrane protein HdeD (DUF308 family)